MTTLVWQLSASDSVESRRNVEWYDVLRLSLVCYDAPVSRQVSVSSDGILFWVLWHFIDSGVADYIFDFVTVTVSVSDPSHQWDTALLSSTIMNFDNALKYQRFVLIILF